MGEERDLIHDPILGKVTFYKLSDSIDKTHEF